MLKISIKQKNKNLFLFAVLLLCSAQKVAAVDSSGSGTDSTNDSSYDQGHQSKGWLSYIPNSVRQTLGTVGKKFTDSAGWVKDGAVSAGSALYNSAGNLGQGIVDSAGWVKAKTWDKVPSWSSFYGGAQQGANDGNLVELAQRNLGLNAEDKNFLNTVIAKRHSGGAIPKDEKEQIWGKVKKIAEARGINADNLGSRIEDLRGFIKRKLGHLLS